MDIEPYKYTLKLQIYISNRIHTIRNYTYVHACMYIELGIYTSNFLHLYINLNTHIIEITHICIKPYKHTSKLHLYKWYHTSKSKCICTHQNSLFILQTVNLCMLSLLIWSIEPWKLLYKSKLWPTGQQLHKQGLQTRTPVGNEKPADWLRTARLVSAFTWGELVIRLCRIFPEDLMVSKEHLTFCLQDYGFASRPRFNYYLTSIVSYICQSTEAVFVRTYLIWVFVWRGRGTTFNRWSRCCDIGLSRSPKAWHFRKSWKHSVMGLEFTGLPSQGTWSFLK